MMVREKIDILKYQIDEIENSKISENEYEDLKVQRNLMMNAEKIKLAIGNTYEFIYSGNNLTRSVHDLMNESIKEFSVIAEFNNSYGEILKKIENIYYLIEDVVEELRNEDSSIEFDEENLNYIEDRINIINNMKRKYGKSIKDIYKYLDDAKIELNDIIKAEDILKDIEIELNKIKSKMVELATNINLERKKIAIVMENKIMKELEDLQMKNSSFSAVIEFCEDNFRADGFDKVEFMISTNPGEPLKPLSKIASGGEMSRIMLAIKCILAQADKIPTLIFDEIDTGISGSAAQKVSEKLTDISVLHQVICVTHLAQIASMADNNYFINKIADKNTFTKIKKLNDIELRKEISRLLSGETSKITLEHADELIDKANKYKKCL